MDEVASRIAELIETKSLTNKQFADRLSLNPAIVSHILSGRNKPSLYVIQQIEREFTDVNIAYLLNGKGRLLLSQPPNATAPSSPREEPQQAYSTAGPEALRPEGLRAVAPPGSTPLSAVRAQSEQSAQEFTNVNKASAKGEAPARRVERIVIFYSDKTFEEYREALS
jgi:Helix-turn-helix.